MWGLSGENLISKRRKDSPISTLLLSSQCLSPRYNPKCVRVPRWLLKPTVNNSASLASQIPVRPHMLNGGWEIFILRRTNYYIFP